MITIALSAISLALAGSTPTVEPIPAPSAPVTAAKPATAAPTRYCVQGVPTGSILRQKVCHTREEWKDLGFDPLARK